MDTRVAAPSQNVILEAIREAMQRTPANDGAPVINVDELRAATGWGAQRARAAIKAMIREGRMELTHVQRAAMDGSIRTVPAYRLREAP